MAHRISKGLQFLIGGFELGGAFTHALLQFEIQLADFVSSLLVVLDDVQQRYHLVYRFNPVAALVVALRSILLDSTSPRMLLLLQLASISVFMLVLGLFVFRRLKERFYDYL